MEETGRNTILTSECIIKLQEEITRGASRSGELVHEAFKQLCVEKGWGNATELMQELEAVEDSIIAKKKPNITRAQVHFKPIDPKKFDEIVRKALLSESRQIHEGVITSWLANIWGWVRSVFSKRLRTTQQISKETQELLNKINHSNWTTEAKMHIRESLRIKGM